MAITFEMGTTDVANESLGQLGKDFINDIEDTTDPVAVKCKRYYASILRSMLRDHPYRFSMHRSQLAWTGIRPPSVWEYAYALPHDCVRVWQVNGSDKSVWKVEGADLLSHESRVIIEYGRWLPDPNLWDGAFHQAFVTYLSVRLAPAFQSDMAKASDLYKLYQGQSWDAKAISGQEGSQETITCDDIVDDIRDR